MKKVLILIEIGFEEVEALTPADLLRRAGIEVVLATSARKKLVMGRNAITILCDETYSQLADQKFDMLLIPGGAGGVEELKRSQFVLDLIQKFHREQKWIAAICAGPLVLKTAGILKNQTLTSYPSAKGELEGITNYVEDRVVVDGNLITSRGPGTAIEFGLSLIKNLLGGIEGIEKANQIKTQVVG
jgi:DJ-1 family protein